MVTRRDFLKLAGMGAAAAGTALVGLPSTRPGAFHPPGERRIVATLCGECPAGCALNLVVAGDRLLELQANPLHPLSGAAPCAGVEAAFRRLESPARLPDPLRRSAGRGGDFQRISWAAAAALVADTFAAYPAGEIAFVLSDYPDHLYDLVQRLAGALGGSTVLRVTPASLLDARVTLQDAARRLFGLPRLPYFDLSHSDLVFSFGLSGAEPWLAHCAVPSTRPPGQVWVHFAPLRPSLLAAGDEWVSLRPGSEALLAQALGSLVALLKAGADLAQSLPSEIPPASQAGGVALQDLLRLARRFAGASSALALPGAGCLGQSGGLAAVQSVLALNVAVENLGRPGGVYLTPQTPLHPELDGRTATLAEVQSLLRRIESGQVKALFVHGLDLLADLPAALETRRALQKIERLISFNALVDETSPYADALLPDHLPLESWGYQRLAPAADRPLVSTIQPAFAPRYATRSTAGLLLQAAHRTGGKLAALLPYRDEQEFIRQAVTSLPWGGVPDPWARWLAQGGWWPAQPGLLPPVSLRPLDRLRRQAQAPWALDPSGSEFYLYFAPSSAGPAGFSAPPGDLIPAALHPAAAHALGLRPGDAVRLATAAGEIEAVVVENPEIRPDTLYIPLQRSQPGSPDPWKLVGGEQNESGDLAYQSGRVRVISVRA